MEIFFKKLNNYKKRAHHDGEPLLDWQLAYEIVTV